MRWLVVGATGMLGRSVSAAAIGRGDTVVGLARGDSELAVDVTDDDALREAIATEHPDVLINCAALTSLAACEGDPGAAYRINARAVAMMAEATRGTDTRLVHISTDHFWTGDGAATHDEAAPVRVLNEYARTKLAGELYALTASDSLVVRTNIVGWRGWAGRPTFVEWADTALASGNPVPLFDDFHTSSIAVDDLAPALLELVDLGVSGLLNVASSEVATKYAFVREFAEASGRELNPESASVARLVPRRAESAGLNVAKAQNLLGRPLPDLRLTVRSLLESRP